MAALAVVSRCISPVMVLVSVARVVMTMKRITGDDTA